MEGRDGQRARGGRGRKGGAGLHTLLPGVAVRRHALLQHSDELLQGVPIDGVHGCVFLRRDSVWGRDVAGRCGWMGGTGG